MTKITPKQQRVFDYIRDYITTNNKAPYIREIQEGCHINSYKTAVDKLLALEKKGLIKRELNKHRSILVINPVRNRISNGVNGDIQSRIENV